MTNRLKRFAIVSFVGALALIVALVGFFRYLDTKTLENHHTQHNRVLAQIITNSLQHHGLEVVLGITEILGTSELSGRVKGSQVPDDNHHPEPARSPHSNVMAEFDQRLSEHIENLSILKIKLHNRNGVVVYSSRAEEIGHFTESPELFKEALAGGISSSFGERSRFETKDQVLRDVHIHESYLPVRTNGGEPIGVLEIYSDITESIAQRDLMEQRMIMGVLLILGGSYTVLFLIFFRTDRALQREEAERNAYLQQIEQARNELELRVEERTAEIESARYFLQSIIDGIADPVMVIGKDLKVIQMNKAVRDLIPAGGAPSNYEYCYQISHRKECPCGGVDHPCSFEEVLESGKTCKLIHTHYDAGGKSRYVEVTSTPLNDIEGKLLGIIEVSHDITDVIRARDQLQQSEQRIRAVMDTVNSGILTLDGRCIIKDANRSAERIFGSSRDGLIGTPAMDLLGEAFGCEEKGSSEVIIKHLEPLLSQESTEITVSRINGERIPVEVWLGRINVAGDTLFIAVFQDVSQRKRAEEELAQTRQQYFHQEKMAAIGQLAAGILHEVGNPIASISGSIQAIQSAHEDDVCNLTKCTIRGDVMNHLTMIEEQINRLAGITREIADFASPRLGERELLDLNGLIRSTVNLMRYDKRLRKVELNQQLDPSLPAINGIADQLTQVIMNLIINAVDACEAVPGRSPDIVVSTHLHEDFIEVKVTDNGVGMAPDVAFHALDAFYTTKPAGKGTGLGLSLCDTIMAKHGGTISIDSRENEGTVVRLTLPLTADEGQFN